MNDQSLNRSDFCFNFNSCQPSDSYLKCKMTRDLYYVNTDGPQGQWFSYRTRFILLTHSKPKHWTPGDFQQREDLLERQPGEKTKEQISSCLVPSASIWTLPDPIVSTISAAICPAARAWQSKGRVDKREAQQKISSNGRNGALNLVLRWLQSRGKEDWGGALFKGFRRTRLSFQQWLMAISSCIS